MARVYSALRVVLSVSILGGFAVWVFWYVYEHQKDFSVIRLVSWGDLLALFGTFSIILICNGMFVKIVLDAFQIRLRHVECLALSVVSSFANYFLPFRSGTGLRALYLAKLYRFPITDFITTLSVMYLMHMIVNGSLALAGMALVAYGGGPVDLGLWIFFALVIATGLIVMRFDFRAECIPERFPLKQLHRILVGWRQVRGRGRLLAGLWTVTIVFALATVWQSIVAFSAISLSLSWGGALVFAGSKNLALLVGLTPGSLGIVEAVSIYLGRVLDYTTSQALVVQALIRGVAIATLLITTPIGFLWLKRRLAQAQREMPVTGEQMPRFPCS